MDDIVTFKPFGDVHITIEHDDGKIEYMAVKNKVLRGGRIALAKGLTNEFGGTFQYWVNGMAFGSGGTVGGTPRFVDDTLEGLFPPTLITKGVIAQTNPDIPYQAIFTSVLTYSDLAGQIINEMGLVLNSGDYFSVATFGDISKTSSMQLTFAWRVVFM